MSAMRALRGGMLRHAVCIVFAVLPPGTDALAPVTRRIHASIAAHGEEATMLRLLNDVERFLAPDFAAIHVSHGSRLNEAKLKPNQLLVQRNNRVHKLGPRVLAAHILNVAVLESRADLRDDDTIVFLAANQRLFRPCRPYVQSVQLSFSLGQTTDYRPPDELPVHFPSSKWDQLMERLPANDDAFIQRNVWHAGFVQYMHRTAASGAAAGGGGAAAVWHEKPLTYMPHEGSFYPYWLLREFIAAVNGTLLPSLFPAEPQCAEGWTPCEWPEEELLPTYVWQRHRTTLLQRGNFGPPLAMRAWLADNGKFKKQAAVLRSNSSAVLKILDFEERGLAHVCAVKLAAQQIYLLPERSEDV
jgi:hypothetical protein